MEKIKTFVINLPQSAVRRRYMEELLDSIGIFDVKSVGHFEGKIQVVNNRAVENR